MFDVSQENIGVGGLFDGHRCHHAAQAHSTQDRHDFPVTARSRLVDASASCTTRVEPCHRSSYATLVQENQPFRRDRLDVRRELFATLAVGLGVTLNRME